MCPAGGWWRALVGRIVRIRSSFFSITALAAATASADTPTWRPRADRISPANSSSGMADLLCADRRG